MSARTSWSSAADAVFVCDESKERAAFCPTVQKIHRKIAIQRYRHLLADMRAIIDEGIVETGPLEEQEG